MQTKKGFCFPYGATPYKDGVNFSIHAKDVEKITLCLYNENKPTKALEKIPLDPETNRTGTIWHLWVQGLPSTFAYAYEVHIADQKSMHTILDPYAKAVLSGPIWHSPSRKRFSYKPLGKFFTDTFDWENDTLPNLPKRDLIIYEMHVRGFTTHASSKVKFPGTFKGMIEKIPYLIDMGITAVELLPIQEFCEEDVMHINPSNKKKLHNYFGYSTTNFFSPMNRFASNSKEDQAVNELKSLIKELHKNKIEVILDVVFNHTFEGNENGPICSFKALDCNAYYLLNADNQFLNYSGCGNTFNCNHPVAREFIIDALRYWAIEYHIDGFRFDLAAAFNRGRDGAPIDYSPIVEFLTTDPVLSSRKLIAEPWDAAGLYHLGKFASYDSRWSEWNGKYQNTVRNFIKGSSHQKNSFAGAISGSHELYADSPYSSVNFIVAHDGFSLADVVCYNEKHNTDNGENNADGLNDNNSWNCGVEGPTTNKKILSLRKRQLRNLHLALMVSQGIPMIYMGDEYAHTKNGNNNPWGQDNEINWFLWDQLTSQADFHRYYKNVIHFRKNCPLLKFEHFLTENEIHWHGLKENTPEWDNDNKLVAFSLHFPSGDPGLYVAFNASHLHQIFEIPSPGENHSWEWVVNTHNASPKDFYEHSEKLIGNQIDVPPYSAIMLKSQF